MIRLFCSLLLALLCVSAHASFSASVDRARLTEGESVELTLESDDPTLFGKPDLSPLDALFEVLGTRQVNRLATQNGRAQATTRWIVTLLPKQSGYVAIPPINLGASSTQPIRLHVLEARDRAKSSKLAPVFIDASVDQETVYVQAQAILTLRIYHSVSLYDDSSLTPLAMNDAKVEQLGEARTYEKEINGIRHGVIEVRYAIFPQKSGTLEIPAQAFSATLVDRGSDDYNPFGPRPGRQMRVTSPSIPLQVRPKPADYPADAPWMPARALSISESWSPQPEQAQVGESLTRNVLLKVEGFPAPSFRRCRCPTCKACGATRTNRNWPTRAPTRASSAVARSARRWCPSRPGASSCRRSKWSGGTPAKTAWSAPACHRAPWKWPPRRRPRRSRRRRRCRSANAWSRRSGPGNWLPPCWP